jgi:hypothetical protein
MSFESGSAVLLLSALPEAHAPLLQALKRRGVTVALARCGRRALRRLSERPALVLVDLVHGADLDARSIGRINGASTTVLGVHDGDLDRFSGRFSELVVDGFCSIDEWSPILELAALGRDAMVATRGH